MKLTLFLAFLLYKDVLSKRYDKCDLYKELTHKFPREEVPTWVCIAFYESSFDTSAIGRLNADGSADHGLFQINDRYWCSRPASSPGCGIPCERLRDDDISDDVVCVRHIFDETRRLQGNGFLAWVTYNLKCRGNLSAFLC